MPGARRLRPARPPSGTYRIWSRQKELFSNFAEYEQKTSRAIPVGILQAA
jgi:hypothetical protein